VADRVTLVAEERGRVVPPKLGFLERVCRFRRLTQTARDWNLPL
jgi:hypothetical protein